MTLIEGIGDEVTQFFIALFTIIIVTFAWWTTNISEQRHVRTVLLLDRRRRSSRRISRRLTNHTETTTISEGTTLLASVNEESRSSEDIPPREEIPSTSSQVNKTKIIAENTTSGDQENEEQNNIIETMDADQNIVRQRRLAFYENTSGSNVEERPGESSNSDNTVIQQVELPQSSDECAKTVDTKTETEKEISASEETTENHSDKSGITIKLKYINDDLKIVDGKLEELLGDFKRRHFQPELNSNKIVRLIFNGQVLQQDRQTLQGCGLFDNCVVHCLIHQKRNSPNEERSTQNTGNIPNDFFSRDSPFLGATNNINNNNQGRDWDLGNFLFALISFILLAAWYFRYVYAHLYTVTATVGLILITGIFTIVLVGMYFPDNEQLPNPSIGLGIRIARAERVEVQQ